MEGGEGEKRVRVSFHLRVGDRTLEAEVTLPAGPRRPLDLLPALFAFADAYLSAVTAQVAEQGRRISCRAGCGACCSQLVPVSETEAWRLAQVVAGLPAARQAVVRRRFRQAIERLAAAGLLERLRHTERLADLEARRRIGMEYFCLGIPCPFLEEQNCSIYPDRPLRCREYLVTSPAAHCADPRPETIEMVPLPVKFSEILFCFGDGRGGEATRWLALPLALEWAEQHDPGAQPALPAPELFRNFLVQIAPPPR
jgi:Fe-S-cluster containining protein